MTLDPDALVIADNNAPLSLAGIIGGNSSAVSETTNSLFIESACFDPSSIFITSQKHGLFTESALRFDKGVDVSFIPQAARMAASLICRSGGRATKGLLDVYPNPGTPKTIVFRRRRIAELLGMEVTSVFIETLFGRLGFGVENYQPDVWQIRVPFHRMDITKETDLVEEVGRFYGYDRIPAKVHPVTALPPKSDIEGERKEGVRQILFHQGFDEVVNAGLLKSEEHSLFKSKRIPVSILNPNTSKLAELRASLLPELVSNLSRNLNRDAEGVHIFEIGNIHYRENDGYGESLSLGLVSSGKLGFPHWQKKQRQTDIYFVKGACESVMFRLGYPAFSFKSGGGNGCEPNLCLSILLKGQKLGFLGRLNSEVCEYYSIREPVWVAELDLHRLLEIQSTRFIPAQPTKFPSVSRDISFVGNNDIPYQEIIKAFGKRQLSYLESFVLVDRFEGKPVPKNKVSLSFRFVFRHPRKTLLAEEVDKNLKTIIDKLCTQFNFELREGG